MPVTMLDFIERFDAPRPVQIRDPSASRSVKVCEELSAEIERTKSNNKQGTLQTQNKVVRMGAESLLSEKLLCTATFGPRMALASALVMSLILTASVSYATDPDFRFPDSPISDDQESDGLWTSYARVLRLEFSECRFLGNLAIDLFPLPIER